MKIMLAPSNQDNNPYSYAGTNEMVQCVKIANACASYLAGYNVEVFNGDSNKYGFDERINIANSRGMDLFVSIHTNAGGGRGVETYVDLTGKVDALGKKICANISALGVSDRGIKTRIHTDGNSWYTELRATKMPSLMVECAFHDHPTEARWIVENVRQIGEAIAKAIVSQYGLKPKAGVQEPKPEEPKPSGKLDNAQRFCVENGIFKDSDWDKPVTKSMMAWSIYSYHQRVINK